MRRKKQLTACLLAFALLLGMIPASEVSAAKKVSLSNKKLTVTKGKSKTLKVKNTKKKVKWKILSGKKYISLKKKGKVAVSVKGKKKGTATPLANSTNDAEALKNLIAEQKKQGASSELSEDIQNSKQYTWKNGRLVGIDWRKVELKGELSTEKFSALHYLYCNNNQLTSLDVTKNTALTYLSCSDNQLRSLDVTKNTALKTLQCYGNQLSRLDVTKNTKLLDDAIRCDANVVIIRNNN